MKTVSITKGAIDKQDMTVHALSKIVDGTARHRQP
jgi:hypothetical protein